MVTAPSPSARGTLGATGSAVGGHERWCFQRNLQEPHTCPGEGTGQRYRQPGDSPHLREGQGPGTTWDGDGMSRHVPWLLPPHASARSWARSCPPQRAAARDSLLQSGTPAGATGLCRAVPNVFAAVHEQARTQQRLGCKRKGPGRTGWPGRALGVGAGEHPRALPLPTKPQECPSRARAGP